MDDLFTDEYDELNDFGFYEVECQGCDIFRPLNDLGLWAECAGKLERDLIRKRDWDYTIFGYGIGPAEHEEIRKEIIKNYGERLELIAPDKSKEKKQKAKKRKRRKIKAK